MFATLRPSLPHRGRHNAFCQATRQRGALARPAARDGGRAGGLLIELNNLSEHSSTRSLSARSADHDVTCHGACASSAEDPLEQAWGRSRVHLPPHIKFVEVHFARVVFVHVAHPEINSDTFWMSETDSDKSRKYHYFTRPAAGICSAACPPASAPQARPPPPGPADRCRSPGNTPRHQDRLCSSGWCGRR